jgi:hypothetical protein
MVYAWTGQSDSSFRVALWLVCAAGLFQAFSLLALVLYRVTGKALLDNIRQVLRIVTLLAIAIFARKLGFYGVLAGLAVTELIGMLFMVFAIAKTYHHFRAKSLLPDAFKLTVATAVILVVGAVAARIPLPAMSHVRVAALLQLAKVFFACMAAAWPALWLTKSVTGMEGRALMGVFRPRRDTAGQGAGSVA